ncbi:glycosyltransferase family 4 protein [Natronoglomus mannanivorans]|uniref:Glycosyltransferase family 4 protein n=1 Tax=Natronoglomus mannanivorans TaxID=2979990 RepID=A0AAP3E003_9EURY|nr:glycosyltransferase family 4 protein [Halobacteria archaeon AArc-xg1-1]
MHVLCVTDYLNNVGGAELSAQTIIDGLVNSPIISQVTVIGADFNNYEQLDFGGANVVPVKMPAKFDNVPDLVADAVIASRLSHRITAIKDDVDIVHAHHRRAAHAVSQASPAVPTIQTVRDYWPICPISIYSVGSDRCEGCDDCLDECLTYQEWDGVLEPFHRRYLLTKRKQNRKRTTFDCHVFISNHLQKVIQLNADLNGQTTVIYNPVEVDIPNVGKRDKKRFVTASRLSAVKGIDTVVRAIALVQECHPNATLDIYGNGPEEDTLRNLARDLGVSTEVTFHGRQSASEVYQSMATATATIFPSKWEEPFGRITVESMKLGTPVIGSDTGGIGELITPERTGLLFPPDDHQSLAAEIRRVIEDSELALQIEREGRVFSREFSKNQITSDYISLYRNLLEQSTIGDP